MHDQVNTNHILNKDNISNYSVLPSSCFNILRNDGLHENVWDDDGFYPQEC
jgi:hypothetical protein